MSDANEQQAQLPLDAPGTRLRAAREAVGLGTADIAASTRIPERAIVALEAGDYAALAARTYAVGFSRRYARAVGLNEAEIVAAVQEELGDAPASPAASTVQAYEPADPSRVADRRLAWIAGLVAFAIVIGGHLLWREFQGPAMGPASLVAREQAAPAATLPAASPASANGPVVFTATADGVWVKFYDAKGAQLMQKQMASGESYTVPADADGPQLWTGRPEALTITIGGQPAPPISATQKTVKDVPVSAAALLARGAAAPTDAASPAANASPALANPALANPALSGPVQSAPRAERRRPATAPRRASSAPAVTAPPASEAAPDAPQASVTAPESTVSE